MKKQLMCGINGFVRSNISGKQGVSLIQNMNTAIQHRGPDDEDFYIEENNKIVFGLGQVRLAIIDLSDAGSQPMFYKKKIGAYSKKHHSEYTDEAQTDSICIVFNGEIYNYQEIKQDLLTKGYTFSSESDTEVILAAYLEYGQECVNKFNGMRAFVIYDFRNKLLFCSRDRLGIKPFYYYFNNETNEFIFSSELKAILVHKDLQLNKAENIDQKAIDLYFTLGFIPAPYSIFKDVYKLEARQNLIYDIHTHHIQKQFYYTIPTYTPLYNKQLLIKEGKEILKDATKLRMIADVPVGAFLSGGLDSSAVVGEMINFTDKSKLHTFSIGFDGKYDETKYINIVKDYFGTQHHHHYFRGNDFASNLKRYSMFFDEPFNDFGFLPSFKNSDFTHKHVTVALTGDAGDEIFGGYSTYRSLILFAYGKKIPSCIIRFISKTINLIKKEYDYSLLGKMREYFEWLQYPFEEAILRLNSKDKFISQSGLRYYKEKITLCLEYAQGNYGEAQRYYDLLYGKMGDNYLTKTDRTTMSYGIEARSPFFDHRFIELSAKIPHNYKYSIFGGTKLLMREIIKDIVPSQIYTRGKQGFTPPLVVYLKDHTNILFEHITFTKEIINNERLLAFLDKILQRKDYDRDSSFLIRNHLFVLWYKKWIKE